MLQIFRNTFVIRLASFLLLGLLALKTGGLLSTIMTGKDCIAFNIGVDADELEKEKKKDAEKPCKSLFYLLANEVHGMNMDEEALKSIKRRHSSFFHIDHFDTVPSPPPDLNV